MTLLIICDCGHGVDHHNWLDEDCVFCMYEIDDGTCCSCVKFESEEDADERFYQEVIALEGGES
jgi:hypothetical protein